MRLCQLEFCSRDIEASLIFAKAILGWNRVPVAIDGMAIIEVADSSSFGLSIRQGFVAPEGPLLAYFEVELSFATLRERCLALGARIHQEPKVVIGYGEVMVVEDRGGLRFGFYEARFQSPK